MRTKLGVGCFSLLMDISGLAEVGFDGISMVLIGVTLGNQAAHE